MKDLKLEMLQSESFKVLKELPECINIEEKEIIAENINWKDEVKHLINLAIEMKVKRIGILINKTSKHYPIFSKLLLNLGFEQYTSKVEVFRSLQNIEGNKSDYEWRSIGNNTMSEDEFKMLWEQCMSGSKNKASSPLLWKNSYNQ